MTTFCSNLNIWIIYKSVPEKAMKMPLKILRFLRLRVKQKKFLISTTAPEGKSPSGPVKLLGVGPEKILQLSLRLSALLYQWHDSKFSKSQSSVPKNKKDHVMTWAFLTLTLFFKIRKRSFASDIKIIWELCMDICVCKNWYKKPF